MISIDNFYFKNKNGVLTLHCRAFDDAGFEKHCFTTRIGGVSEGYLASTNLSFSRECEQNVRENFRRIKDAVGFTGGFALTKQEHTDIVKVCDSVGDFSIPTDAVDGLVTNKQGICLTVYIADCVPVLIADPKTRTVAAVHSGWRGTAKKITENALRLMSQKFGTDPKDVIAAIGPCIGKCCYEVGADVFEDFGVPEYFTEKTGGKYMLDLNLANTDVLRQCGVPHRNIFVSGECTFCKSDVYYSHRATKGKRGNLAAMIEI